jgi:hypothetical protein
MNEQTKKSKALSALSDSQIEQRDRDTEKQSFRRDRDSDDTHDTDEAPPSGACVDTLQKAAEMALKDTSNGDPIFTFARAIKSFELYIDSRLPESELQGAFNVWWPRGALVLPPGTDREESLFLFMDAYAKAKTPLGCNIIKNTMNIVKNSPPPPEANRYKSPKLKLLVHLCFALQSAVGDGPFFLRVCFKNPERTHFLGDSIGLAGKKAHENEISY